jgi:hypothetical protein
MIINEIKVECITVFKAENDAPVTGNPHTPKTFEVPFQRVKVVARHVEVPRFFSDIQKAENILDQFKLVSPNLAPITAFIQPL